MHTYSNKVSLKISVRRESISFLSNLPNHHFTLPTWVPCKRTKRKKRTSRDASERQDRKKQRIRDRETDREPQRKQISETMRKRREASFYFSNSPFSFTQIWGSQPPPGPTGPQIKQEKSWSRRPQLFFRHPTKNPPTSTLKWKE